MTEENENYTFPWGFHLGDLHAKDGNKIPLYTDTKDGGFCLLYDKASERKADYLLESLCLELLSTMPFQSLKVHMFDFGKKKFFNLSGLQFVNLYEVSHDAQMINEAFQRIEKMIISRHTDLLCCNRQSINEHNQKSKLKKEYHLILMNLDNFPTEEIELRRIKNFVESAYLAGVYVIAFGNNEIENSQSPTTQAILQHFKNIKVTNNEFALNKEIFEFVELLEDHTFESLNLERANLLQKILTTADVDNFMDPGSIQLESNTKV